MAASYTGPAVACGQSSPVPDPPQNLTRQVDPDPLHPGKERHTYEWDEVHGYEFIWISWAGSSATGKTQRYLVGNNRSGDTLGEVRWFGRWHQYTFFPKSDCVFSAGCLRDIADFITGLRGK